MPQKELSELTDSELLEAAKKQKPAPIVNALLIGFLIGIIIYSMLKNSVGLFTLVPLYFVYKMFNNSNSNKELDRLLKERNLK